MPQRRETDTLREVRCRALSNASTRYECRLQRSLSEALRTSRPRCATGQPSTYRRKPTSPMSSDACHSSVRRVVERCSMESVSLGGSSFGPGGTGGAGGGGGAGFGRQGSGGRQGGGGNGGSGGKGGSCRGTNSATAAVQAAITFISYPDSTASLLAHLSGGTSFSTPLKKSLVRLIVPGSV